MRSSENCFAESRLLVLSNEYQLIQNLKTFNPLFKCVAFVFSEIAINQIVVGSFSSNWINLNEWASHITRQIHIICVQHISVLLSWRFAARSTSHHSVLLWAGGRRVPSGPRQTSVRLKWRPLTLAVSNCLLVWEWVTVTVEVNVIAVQYLHHVVAAWQRVARGSSLQRRGARCDKPYVTAVESSSRETVCI